MSLAASRALASFSTHIIGTSHIRPLASRCETAPLESLSRPFPSATSRSVSVSLGIRPATRPGFPAVTLARPIVHATRQTYSPVSTSVRCLTGNSRFHVRTLTRRHLQPLECSTRATMGAVPKGRPRARSNGLARLPTDWQRLQPRPLLREERLSRLSRVHQHDALARGAQALRRAKSDSRTTIRARLRGAFRGARGDTRSRHQRQCAGRSAERAHLWPSHAPAPRPPPPSRHPPRPPQGASIGPPH